MCRRIEAGSGPTAPAGETKEAKRRTGPKPLKRENIAERMARDYSANPAQLHGEKVELLTTKYNAAKGTVTKARTTALAKLRLNRDPTLENSGRTLNTGK